MLPDRWEGMNTRNLSNGRFFLAPSTSTWLLSSAFALALASVACGAAPDPQSGEAVESTPATAEPSDDSDAGPAVQGATEEPDPAPTPAAGGAVGRTLSGGKPVPARGLVPDPR